MPLSPSPSCLYNVLVNGEQSCAQGFQSWDETVDVTTWTEKGSQYILPSLNFSCGGVISSWSLNPGGNVRRNQRIELQLWRLKAESTYTLQTEQTHTAGTEDAPSYTFTASPPMKVAAGDVFGFYVPRSKGIKMATVAMPLHTVFILQTSVNLTEFPIDNAGLKISPLISIKFSKFIVV